MKTFIEFAVTCSQCVETERMKTTTLFPHKIADLLKDAQVYFEQTGWLQLPSGLWLCRRHRSAAAMKEAA